MTSSVKINAHCANNKEVHIEISGDPCGNDGVKVIQDGESLELSVYDNKSVTIKEVIKE